MKVMLFLLEMQLILIMLILLLRMQHLKEIF